MPLRSIEEITVPPNRLRREITPKQLEELIASILDKGLLHPPVVEKDGMLLAGERRFRAICTIAERGLTHQCNGKFLRPGLIWTTDIRDLSPTQKLEAELEENTIRVDLTWQEKAQAVEGLHRLRMMQKVERAADAEDGVPPAEQTPRETAAEIRGKASEEVTRHEERDVRADLIVAAWLANGADDAVARAATRAEALKIIENNLEDQHHIALAREFNLSRAAGAHILRHGDALPLLAETPPNVYDLIITDPPYGIGAEKWENQGATRHHTYADDRRTSDHLYNTIAVEGFRICKPKAHLYFFCPFQRFEDLARMCRAAGWDVWPRPLIWFKGHNGGIAPRPEHGPRLTYECILYGIKGDRKALVLTSDVLAHFATKLERAAQKPPSIYHDLMRRSVLPGDEVLDPCCGTGPVFPAANALSVRATGYDLDEVAIGIAQGRLAEKFTPTAAPAVAKKEK